MKAEVKDSRFAQTFAQGNLYRLLIRGRTGKKNPRLAMPFLNPEARVAKTMSRPGYHTFDDGNLKDIE
ncbi:hypothetical protein [Aminivibrio sp.]|uniref:hypothetical protein n=1 Tax=Aminivibrio sp. TaxID=1872489 RepID=UPI001A580265|nr:hypothetical protein [Aminivibrio sp.]MBL3540209.1 hypothetical protein [Aminivibrio sp.]